jgi:cytochrome c-type biogenesis protein CcmH/NrfG
MPKKSKTNKKLRKSSLKSEIVYICSCCAVIVIALLASVNLNQFIKTKDVLGAGSKIADESPQMLTNQKKYWNDFLTIHPTYLDGWIELTRIYLEEGNPVKARESFDRAFEISPNSRKIEPYKEVFK